MGKCKETAGVLFAHACVQEAARTCTQCSKPICDLHTRELPAGFTCIECYKQVRRGDPGADSDPYLLSASYFPDYDTGGLSAPQLHRSLSTGADHGDELGDDTLFEGDFDGT